MHLSAGLRSLHARSAPGSGQHAGPAGSVQITAASLQTTQAPAATVTPSSRPPTKPAAPKKALPRSVRTAAPVGGIALLERNATEARNGLLHEPASPAGVSSRILLPVSAHKLPIQPAQKLQEPLNRWRGAQDTPVPAAGQQVVQARMLDVISIGKEAMLYNGAPPRQHGRDISAAEDSNSSSALQGHERRGKQHQQAQQQCAVSASDCDVEVKQISPAISKPPVRFAPSSAPGPQPLHSSGRSKPHASKAQQSQPQCLSLDANQAPYRAPFASIQLGPAMEVVLPVHASAVESICPDSDLHPQPTLNMPAEQSAAALSSVHKHSSLRVFARSLVQPRLVRIVLPHRQSQPGRSRSQAAPPSVTVQAVFSATPQTVHGIISQASDFILNRAISALGASGKMRELLTLLAAMSDLARANEHTYASAFFAFSLARRPDLVMHYFDDLCRRNIDIGPVGASALMKLCAQERDLGLALEVFNRLVEQHTTLNRWTYNCLAHLCGVLGRLEELQAVFSMMMRDPDKDNRPDSYTYSAIVRCIITTKRWDLLGRVYMQMAESHVAAAPEVWCHFITAAARSNNPGLAQRFFDACVLSGMEPTQQIYNALLAAMSKTATLEQMLTLYRRMLASGAAPDDYTFNALLTASAQLRCRASIVEELVGETRRWGVRLNVHLGTSLVNAYARTPELASGDRAQVAHLLELADDILAQLRSARLVNTLLYTVVASMHAQAGDADGMMRTVQEMHHLGLPIEVLSCQKLARACVDGGLIQHAEHFATEARALERQARVKQQHAKGNEPSSQQYSGARDNGRWDRHSEVTFKSLRQRGRSVGRRANSRR